MINAICNSDYFVFISNASTIDSCTVSVVMRVTYLVIFSQNFMSCNQFISKCLSPKHLVAEIGRIEKYEKGKSDIVNATRICYRFYR